MEGEIKCPICGKMTFHVYRRKWDNGFAGCDHCAPILQRGVGVYDKRTYPADYEPPKVHCPKCGELCRTIYRTERHADIVGCDRCLYPVDAVQDADAVPDDYGLEEEVSDDVVRN